MYPRKPYHDALVTLADSQVTFACPELTTCVFFTLPTQAPAPSAAAPPSSSGKGGAAFDDDDDDGPPTKGSNKKGGKKGGKGGGGGGGGAGAAAGKQGKAAGKGGAADASEQGLSSKQIEDLLSKTYPELPDAAGGDLLQALASSLQPAAQAALEAARRALFAEGQEGRKKRREALGKRLQDGWAHLLLMGAGAGLFAGDEGNQAQHVRHVLRTEAADAVDAALLLAVRALVVTPLGSLRLLPRVHTPAHALPVCVRRPQRTNRSSAAHL